MFTCIEYLKFLFSERVYQGEISVAKLTAVNQGSDLPSHAMCSKFGSIVSSRISVDNQGNVELISKSKGIEK